MALLVALAAFLLVYFVPFVKYPANPPAVGHAETIDQRTSLYLTMLGLSILFGIAAVLLGRTLHRRRISVWTSTLLAGAAFVVATGIVMLILPSLGELATNRAEYGDFPTETPQPLTDPRGNIVYPGFPADVLFLFRLHSVGAQLIVWAAIGLVFAPLAERVLEPQRRQERVSVQSEQTPASGASR
jgi:hypothetical protein